MMFNRLLPILTLASITALASAEAGATAVIGSLVSAYAGSGACTDQKVISNAAAVHDTLALSATAACNGTSASVNARGDAATASVGLFATSSADLPGSSSIALGRVNLTDTWTLTAPLGSTTGNPVIVPVAITLEGNIAAGSVFGAIFDGFLDYNLSIVDHFNPSAASGFRAIGSISTTGTFSQTFTGTVALTNFNNPAVDPLQADIRLNLDVPDLIQGTVDFFNTAVLSLDLPAGFSAFTSSGVELNFEPPSSHSTSEPATLALLGLGFGGIDFVRRRHLSV